MGAYAKLSCILVANKIRVGESPVSPCVRENSEASRRLALRVPRRRTRAKSRRVAVGIRAKDGQREDDG